MEEGVFREQDVTVFPESIRTIKKKKKTQYEK